MSLFYLLPTPFANRFVGTGIWSRVYSMPIACVLIGLSMSLTLHLSWLWALAFGVAFFIGRSPNVATALSLASYSPEVQPNRDGWDTKWITAICNNNPFIWAYIRITTFYTPFFLLISDYGVMASSIYGVCWASCYSASLPICKKFGIADSESTAVGEMSECVLFMVIIAALTFFHR